MSFPDPSLVPPALQPWQLSFGGLTFGGVVPGSTYQFQTLNVDMPDVASGDVQRALDQGEFAGMDTLPGADITLVQGVYCGSHVGPAGATLAQGQALDTACQALGGVLGPGGATETPLWYQLPSGTFCRLARARKHNCPVDINRVRAGASIATSLFHSTDPRWYAAPSIAQTVAIPASPGGGLTLGSGGAVVPWVLAAGFAGASVNVVNSGKFESRPVLLFTGPGENPAAYNNSLPGSPYVGVTIALNAGDTLVVDLDWQTAVYTLAGTTQGTDVKDLLMLGSTWWNLPANTTNAIGFLATGGMTMTVQSASAYLSL
jgi:hypothetical protein